MRAVIPKPVIRERAQQLEVYQELIDARFLPLVANLLSRRISCSISQQNLFRPSLGSIPDPNVIPDMERAVERIAKAVVEGEDVIFAVDHDMDGQGSAAVLWSAFTELFEVPSSRLSIVTSHRLTEGYGINDAVADRIIASKASLIISADKGSSDEARINRIALAGKDVIVTDHHEVPIEGPPKSAYACVNPARHDSTYDPYICGAGVVFMVMAKVRSKLLSMGYRRELRSLSNLTDYVAVATIADCVALRPDRSSINRALIRSGLAQINQLARPCWQVFRRHLKDEGPIDSQSIAFSLAPAVASAGRLDWAEVGFRFLVAKTEEEAERHWSVLAKENDERKSIEKRIREAAMEAALQEFGPTIVVFVENGHSGVHGITASRLVEKFGKPSAVFSVKGVGARASNSDSVQSDGTVITGSFRSVDGVHIRDALQIVADARPGMMLSFGGHAGAAGASLLRDSFPEFKILFNEAVEKMSCGRELVPVVWTDGTLLPRDLHEATVEMFTELDPWGRDFPLPIFHGNFEILECVPMGDGSHWRLLLGMEQRSYEAVWFSATAPGGKPPVTDGVMVLVAYRPKVRIYKGRRKLQLEIVAVNEVE